MKRYHLFNDGDIGGGMWSEVEEDEAGEWVRAEDALAEIAKLRDLAKAQAELLKLQSPEFLQAQLDEVLPALERQLDENARLRAAEEAGDMRDKEKRALAELTEARERATYEQLRAKFEGPAK